RVSVVSDRRGASTISAWRRKELTALGVSLPDHTVNVPRRLAAQVTQTAIEDFSAKNVNVGAARRQPCSLQADCIRCVVIRLAREIPDVGAVVLATILAVNLEPRGPRRPPKKDGCNLVVGIVPVGIAIRPRQLVLERELECAGPRNVGQSGA